MSEEKEGFFSQIKNQILTTVGIVITAAGGLLVSNMENIFSPKDSPPTQQAVSVTEPQQSKTDTLVIIKKEERPVLAKPASPEKKDKEFDW